MSAITSKSPGRPVLLSLALLAAAAVPAAPPAWPPAPGQNAPVLVAYSFSGEALDFARLRGKVVVLNFWASWCGPCRSEMPLLDGLSREYRDRGVVVVGLSADDRHDRRDAVAAARAVSYFTGLLTEASANGFGAPQVLPLTYIITPTGLISEVLRANRGALSAAQLRGAVEAALGGADRAPAKP